MNKEKKGEVLLVGAGCGRGMITAAGLKAVRSAEVLVYDDLIDDDLLREAPAACGKLYVGKRSGAHSKKQEEISALLVREAASGKRVVRLKGGDSFVFGRGGEEFLALKQAGIPCRLIPGVTSAVAVPERLGIPVTHRGAAQSFTVVTGHTASETEENYEALAALQGTLVFLMGIRSLGTITEKLLRYGKAPETPAAVLVKGFTPQEQRISGTLENIAALAADAPTPGILVVGQTAAMDLRTPEGGALSGVSVTVTGTPAFTEKTAALLEEAGAYAERRPCMRIIPLEERIPGDPAAYSWIAFTSTNGVRIFFDHLRKTGTDLRTLSRVKIACIGRGTADSLAEYLIRADLVPPVYTAEELGKALGKTVRPGEKVLILRAEQGSVLLNRELDRAGIEYDDVRIYRTEAVLPAGRTEAHSAGKATEAAAPAGGVGAAFSECGTEQDSRTDGFSASGGYLVFGSAGCVRAWFSGNTAAEQPKAASAGASTAAEQTKAVCIGDCTAAEYRKITGREPITAETCTAEGIVQAILADRAADQQCAHA